MCKGHKCVSQSGACYCGRGVASGCATSAADRTTFCCLEDASVALPAGSRTVTRTRHRRCCVTCRRGGGGTHVFSSAASPNGEGRQAGRQVNLHTPPPCCLPTLGPSAPTAAAAEPAAAPPQSGAPQRWRCGCPRCCPSDQPRSCTPPCTPPAPGPCPRSCAGGPGTRGPGRCCP